MSWTTIREARVTFQGTVFAHFYKKALNLKQRNYKKKSMPQNSDQC